MGTSTDSRPVVVGSGLAGLTVARALAPERCILVTPDDLTAGAASMWAQGGIAAAIGEDDSPELHAVDTRRAGADLGDAGTIARITAAAPDVVRRLRALGVPFDLAADQALDLALEGGHSRRRIAHAGDRSGAAITRTVAGHVATLDSVEIRTGLHARGLVTDGAGKIAGLALGAASGAAVTIDTDRIVLATGGLGGLFAHTTNPRTALGQGIAMASRVGARTDDLHFVQFHPTALDVGLDPMPLLTEALRGAGAVLLADGARFVDELQPRDVVAAAVWAQAQSGRRVVLDARDVPDVLTRFPAVADLVSAAGLDLASDLLPVAPAVHYAMGGVTVDARSRTSVPGLWAVGEVARTGLHGGNRLASNSLLEAVVSGEAAAADLTGDTWRAGGDMTAADRESLRAAGEAPAPALDEVRQVLESSCGVLRTAHDLRAAVDRLDAWTQDDAAYVGWLIARSALADPRSVGAHRRVDTTAAGSAA
ncbi:FAD-binding protein [Allobranchiibius sp. GilTou38]|uniref:L-aspartate oxidase n=1 Tax=Allobranchiibius sp. GilTou38 TaxID=2815210 RepID=UPI001AA1C443|nr:FAD-binding protein [Allobranchiibius sp. GilTou38]MBO1768410.1 FAD-binding protein [Allobranchiibius sp. GilTou38]